ncbi:hypothetical protein [Pseudomonas moraviensis]|uniref:hypothetical protein n=1 Tax=Pseudomonas moraviensis TaxID=321662 RepID=UPI002E349226|nr:hypothetical protein [Pseudomonas moraviensis]
MIDVSSVEISPRPEVHDLTLSTTNFGSSLADASQRLPAVEIFQLPAHSSYRTEHPASISDYWLSEAFLRGMQPADIDGFRWVVGRKFVDVEYQGALQTTHVGVDETGAWRSKLLTERVPSGPRLYKNADSSTWRLTEQPAPKRPRLAPVPTPINPHRYSPSGRSPDAQGYYEMHPLFGSRKDDTHFAFRDSYGNYIPVDPPAGGFAATPTHLKQWTDHEIWKLYGLQGRDIARFRVEAQASGTPPHWADPVTTENPLTNLLRDSLRWLHPHMSLTEREIFLRSFNLLPDQLTRLQQELRSHLAIPAWALAHKRQLDDLANPRRLDQFVADAVEQLNLKRDARHDWYHPESSLTPEVREALLKQLGYLRNKNNCLYRTDIPALFRGDERTPFELANDGTMLPRYHHEPGATTHKPISATFSLKQGQVYASAPVRDYLRFNSQTNKYPGRDTGDSGSESDASDSSSAPSSDWSDPDSPVAWDHERGYRPARARQKEMFLYVLDTRNLEVVPHEENMAFNSAARHTPPTWFPSDDFEGLISVTRSGIAAERVWLLNKDLTKAARVEDIKEQAGANADRIEAATHAGHFNRFEYDQLIDQVEAAGLPILRLSGNENQFAYDIAWPESAALTQSR